MEYYYLKSTYIKLKNQTFKENIFVLVKKPVNKWFIDYLVTTIKITLFVYKKTYNKLMKVR